MKYNQKGFSGGELMLVLVIFGIIGATGYFVHSIQKKTNDSLDKTANSKNQLVSDFRYKNIVIPADWKTYSNKEHGFSFKYPAEFEVTEGSFKIGESADSAVFFASAAGKEDVHGGYSVRVLKTSLDNAIKNDPLNTNDNIYGDTIKTKNISISGYKAVELSYVPGGKKVSWFFVERDEATILRFELVEDTGKNAMASKAIYNSLEVQ